MADAPGTYTVSFTVTDGVSSNQVDVVITVVAADVLPIITVPGPQNASVGGNLRFIVSANDPTASGAFSFTPSSTQAGQTFVVNFTATDSNNPSWTKTESVPIQVQGSTSTPS